MADGVLRRATRRDRQFVGWRQFGTVVTANLFFVTLAAAKRQAGGGLWWVLLGALAILCPLLAQHLGRWFLSNEVQGDPAFWRMVGWRLLCFAISIAPLLLAGVKPAL